MTKKIWLLLLVSLVISCVKAQWTVDNYPNPMKDPRSCGRRNISNVCDPDQLIADETERNKVQFMLLTVREDSKARAHCSDGRERPYQGAVAVMKKMHIPHNTEKMDAASTFARSLGDKWSVGDYGCANGFLFLVSMDDRIVYLRTAPQTRSKITDARSRWITDSMKPFLARGEMSKGLQVGIDLVRRSLEGEDVADPNSGAPREFLIMLAVFAGIILTVFICAKIAERRKRLEAERAQRALNGVLSDMQRAALDDLGTAPATNEQIRRNETCPICLETFPGMEQHDHDEEDSHNNQNRPPNDQNNNNPKQGGANTDISQYFVNATAPTDDQKCPPTVSRTSTANTNNPRNISTRAANRGQAGAGRGNSERDRLSPTQTDVRSLACGHCFHGSCISEWLREHDQCPLCRARVGQDPSSQRVRPTQNETQQGVNQRNMAAYYSQRFNTLFPRIVMGLGGLNMIDEILLRPYRRNMNLFREDGVQTRPSIADRPWEPDYDRVNNLWERLDFSRMDQRIHNFEQGIGRWGGGNTGGFSNYTYNGRNDGGGGSTW